MSNYLMGILWLTFKISCKMLPRIRLWDVMLPISNVWEVLKYLLCASDRILCSTGYIAVISEKRTSFR